MRSTVTGAGWSMPNEVEPGAEAPGGLPSDGRRRGWAPARRRSLGLGPQAGYPATAAGGVGAPLGGGAWGWGPRRATQQS